jgi:hypothetical protein
MDITYYLLVKAVAGQPALANMQRGDFVSQIMFTDRGEPFGSSDGLPYYYRLATDGTAEQVGQLFEQKPERAQRRWRLNFDAVPENLLAEMAGGETVFIPFDQLLNYVEMK